MKRLLLALLSISFIFAVLSASSTAQKETKPWTQWTQKEAEKILNDSPWAQVQTDTDTSEMFFSPTSDPNRMGSSANDRQRTTSGATNQSVNVKFIVRFFSARPVRSALARLMELRQTLDPSVVERLHNFAELKSPDSIIVTVSVETPDQRYAGTVMQQMNSAVTATLKNETYLERNGDRQFLEEYVPPGKDNFGARFIFLRRTSDEKPFIDSGTKEVRFRTKFVNGLTVTRLFKVEHMIYNGELEY